MLQLNTDQIITLITLLRRQMEYLESLDNVPEERIQKYVDIFDILANALPRKTEEKKYSKA